MKRLRVWMSPRRMQQLLDWLLWFECWLCAALALLALVLVIKGLLKPLNFVGLVACAVTACPLLPGYKPYRLAGVAIVLLA